MGVAVAQSIWHFKRTRKAARAYAMTTFEREAHENGFKCIAGVDEAGRGPLAGPIVAAAVVLGERIDELDDSKALTEDQRDTLYSRILAGPNMVGVGVVCADDIDRRGIQSANYAAMAWAASLLTPAPDMLLVDGFRIHGTAFAQVPIVKGDRRSFSIAAASIVAKVTRDRIMMKMDEIYPEYGFASHKGYGTKAHLAALTEYGPCEIHRKSFSPVSAVPETGLLFGAEG